MSADENLKLKNDGLTYVAISIRRILCVEPNASAFTNEPNLSYCDVLE